jgi:hypothetical protein
MWEEDCLYRHNNNQDVAFEILHASKSLANDGAWILDVSWWNIGNCHDPWPMGISQTIRIKKEDTYNWNKMAISERGPKPDERYFSI